MLIPFTQAAQTLAELHEIFVWRCHAEWSLKGSHRRFTTIKSNNLYQGDKHKPEITNYKHHLILKLGQINSKLQYPNLK